jgi:hypothetical protein
VLGRQKLHIEFNAFIPGRLGDWLPEPPEGIFWFNGNSRGFIRQPSEKAKVRTEAEIESTHIGFRNANIESLGGAFSDPTLRYVPPNGAVEERNSVPTGGSWKQPFAKACEMQILMVGSGKYPFTPDFITPAIDYSVTWTFKVVGKNSIRVTVEGTHDGFPNYEAVIDWSIGVYEFDTPSSGPSLINLNTPRSFSATRMITAETGCCDAAFIF